jgi:pimeloyl-ACP methyl ester carboxylesterase
LCRQGATAARFGIAAVVAKLASAGAHDAARTLVAAISRRGLHRQDEEFLAPVTKLPEHVRPMLRWMWTQPRFFEALGSQIESICTSARELDVEPDYGDLPLVTISATAVTDGRRRLQEDLRRRSSRGRHVIARNSGHWIPLDDPETVVSAIRDVVKMARARTA